MTDDTDWISVNEAAKRYGMHHQTMSRLLDREGVFKLPIGSDEHPQYRVLASSVDAIFSRENHVQG